jgi:hypothetical protein
VKTKVVCVKFLTQYLDHGKEFIHVLSLILGFFFFLVVLGFEFRASHVLGGILPLEPHYEPFSVFDIFK